MAYLPNFLALFSADVGMSPDGIVESLERTRRNPDRRELDGLRRELLALYNDPRTDWVTLLWNDEEEVFEAASQEDGRDFVTARIWSPLFPNEAPPQAV